MTRKALLVGVSDYSNSSLRALPGATTDVRGMFKLLSTNHDGTQNFDCGSPMTTRHEFATTITRDTLNDRIERLFDSQGDDVLFYYSGHGVDHSGDVALATADATWDQPGIPMKRVVELANNSRARSVTLILDCCHAAGAMSRTVPNGVDHFPIESIREDVTLLAAARSTQAAMENGEGGVFTSLLVNGLRGAAADIRGRVTAASLYSLVESFLGAWEQRPIYKSHATCATPIRCCEPAVPIDVLIELPKLFTPNADSTHRMDPSYEERDEAKRPGIDPPGNPENIIIFKMFKKLRDAKLLRTEQDLDLWQVAMRSLCVSLSPLGQHYWHLAKEGRLK